MACTIAGYAAQQFRCMHSSACSQVVCDAKRQLPILSLRGLSAWRASPEVDGGLELAGHLFCKLLHSYSRCRSWLLIMLARRQSDKVEVQRVVQAANRKYYVPDQAVHINHLPSFLFSRCGAVLPRAVPSVPRHPLRGFRSSVCSMAPKKPDVIPEVSLQVEYAGMMFVRGQGHAACAQCKALLRVVCMLCRSSLDQALCLGCRRAIKLVRQCCHTFCADASAHKLHPSLP
jgi:hypothetical protein